MESKPQFALNPYFPRYGYSHREIGLSCLTSGGKGLWKSLHTYVCMYVYYLCIICATYQCPAVTGDQLAWLWPVCPDCPLLLTVHTNTAHWPLPPSSADVTPANQHSLQLNLHLPPHNLYGHLTNPCFLLCRIQWIYRSYSNRSFEHIPILQVITYKDRSLWVGQIFIFSTARVETHEKIVSVFRILCWNLFLLTFAVC